MDACRDSARSTRPCHCLRRRVRLSALRCPMHANIVRSPGAPRRRGCQPRGLRADSRAHGDRLHRLTSAAPRSLAPRPRVLRRLDGLDPLTDDASGLAWISIAECDPAVELGLLDERPAFVALTGDPPVASWGPRRVFGRDSPERMNMSCPTVNARAPYMELPATLDPDTRSLSGPRTRHPGGIMHRCCPASLQSSCS